MNKQLRESLSALMDDEADPMEIRRVLVAMEKDPTLLTTWQRMQVASNALRNEMPYTGDNGQCISIAASVSAALRDEPEHHLQTAALAPAVGNSKSNVVSLFGRPLASLAMAATVAAVTVVGVLQYQRFTGQADSAVVGNVAENANDMSNVRFAATPTLNPRLASDGLSRTVSANIDQPSLQQQLSLARSIHQVQAGKAAAQERLFGYMQRHAEHAVFNNNQGIMPMARVVNVSHVQY